MNFIFTKKGALIMMHDDERREHKRIPYINSLTFKLSGSTLSLPQRFLKNADILDISNGGVKIRTMSMETNFEIGSIVFLNIPLPKMPVVVPTIGKVKWIKLDNLKTRQAGIEFIRPE